MHVCLAWFVSFYVKDPRLFSHEEVMILKEIQGRGEGRNAWRSVADDGTVKLQF